MQLNLDKIERTGKQSAVVNGETYIFPSWLLDIVEERKKNAT
ncbi:gp047 [Rhodococcus phage ReqiDocB7]|nr:gp047 [Rhodococcus phage ReqiDocB7]ADD80833.1 gp047 [Rhodococcus phage ReqiDocB7]